MRALDYLAGEAKNLNTVLQEICEVVIADPRFQRSPGGSEHHHNFGGGLIVHTAEVVWGAVQLTKWSPIVNSQVLIAAAILHDRNKIFEYGLEYPENGHEWPGRVTKKPYRKLIGHVAGSWEYFMSQVHGKPISESLVEDISHVMLAHHGRLEWRSPVEPLTPEAFALHSADMLSATGWEGLPKFSVDKNSI